jgi:hypothetical protein
MKKILALCAALLAGGLFADEAAAQGPPPGMMQPGPGAVPSPYGWHPRLQKLAIAHGSDNCGKFNLLGRLFIHKSNANIPPVENGTLVFPNNPFTRSPRDFFMLDQ